MLGHARQRKLGAGRRYVGLEDVGDMRVDLRLRHIAQRMAGRQRFAGPDFPVAEALAMELVHLGQEGSTDLLGRYVGTALRQRLLRVLGAAHRHLHRRHPLAGRLPGPHLGEQRGIERILDRLCRLGKADRQRLDGIPSAARRPLGLSY